MSHAEHHNIPYPLQHGFRPGRSCETQLLEMAHNLVNNMQLGLQTDICVLDFSKSFDKVGHRRLVEKLRMYGNGETNIRTGNFLTDRSQSILDEGASSDCPCSYLRCTSRLCTGPLSLSVLHK